LPVFFHSTDIPFSLKQKNVFRKWISSEITRNSFKPGQINIIFCSDDYLLEINKKYLNHDFYTDIISFNFNKGSAISGDLYISVQRVSENAVKFETNLYTELSRVIIHGILHLLGHDDNTLELKKKIHVKEDAALKRFSHFFPTWSAL
jgi:probable rRNA maturation factor